MSEHFYDIYFDTLVGPAYLGDGIPSPTKTSNPKARALLGLEKMHLFHKLGIPQAVLPPHERPHLPTLRSLGFSGDDAEVIASCAKESPELLKQFSSSAFIYTANWATATPSCDANDRRAHFSPANLSTHLNRAVEQEFTLGMLKRLTNNSPSFICHPPLPGGRVFSDEGSANHVRLSSENGDSAIHLFAYGYRALQPNALLPKQQSPRQSLESVQSIVRRHNLSEERVIFAQQHPHAIDSGISTTNYAVIYNRNVLICHTEAFVATSTILQQLQEKMEVHTDSSLKIFEVPSNRLSLAEAAATSFFNSQLVTLPDGSMQLICPPKCQDNPKVKLLIDELIQNPSLPINHAVYLEEEGDEAIEMTGSRSLKVSLNGTELNECHRELYLDAILYRELKGWIFEHYRDTLTFQDLSDPQFVNETKKTLDALTRILKLEKLYSFQR